VIQRLPFIFALCSLFAVAGCNFDAPAPNRTPAPATPQPPLSTLSATLTFSAAQIAHILNNMTEYRLIDLHDQQVNCGGVRCRLNLHATRTGTVTVAAGHDVLTVNLPFSVDIDAAAPGVLSFLRAKANGQGTAVAQTGLGVAPDWRLLSKTNGTVRLDNGRLRIGPVVTDIAQLWNANGQSLSAPLWRSIDKQIGSINIKPRIADFWAQAFIPQRLGKNPVSWLVLRPEQIEIARPAIRDGTVVISVGVEARGQVVVQDRQPANHFVPMPRAGTFTLQPGTFSFAVPLLLPYDRAGQLAMASLSRSAPHIAGMTLKFTRLQILPSGQDVVVVAHVCAVPNWNSLRWLTSCDTMNLRGVPQFDAATQTIRVMGLRYDVADTGFIMRFVQAFAGDRLAGVLQSHLVFDESKELGRLRAQVTSALAKPEGGALSISAQVQSFGAPSFRWTADGFLAFFSARGKVVTQLNF
jgi:hypothetical protein